jgi:hypothetical protein
VNINFFDSVVFGAGFAIGSVIGAIPIAVLFVGLGFKSDKERMRVALESVAKNVDIIMNRGK